MKTIRPWIMAAVTVALLLGVGGGIRADDKKTIDTAVSYKQEFAKKKFEELIRKMGEVADALEKSEPASARAIRMAVDQAKRAFIAEDMDKVIEYLNAANLAVAKSTQGRVVEELKKVLDTLERGEMETVDS